MQRCVKKPVPVRARQIRRATRIETPEGVSYGEKGDCLVIGVREKHIVKRGIFEQAYEPATD